MSVRFEVTAHDLALAMALEARNQPEFGGLPIGMNFADEAPEYARFVAAMTKAAALKAARECFWSYGVTSWPDDYPYKAYKVALGRAKGWVTA